MLRRLFIVILMVIGWIFDSTNIATKNNDHIWNNVISLTLAALERTNKICLNTNLMANWGHIPRQSKEIDEQYTKWGKVLVSHMTYWGHKIKFAPAIWSPKQGSLTLMISMHCLIEK